MKLIQEYKTQGIYILFGAIVLIFPFLHPAYLFLIFLVGSLFFSTVKKGSPLFDILAREPDIKAGKLIGLVYLLFTMSILIFISFFLRLTEGFDKFPLFFICCRKKLHPSRNAIHRHQCLDYFPSLITKVIIRRAYEYLVAFIHYFVPPLLVSVLLLSHRPFAPAFAFLTLLGFTISSMSLTRVSK